MANRKGQLVNDSTSPFTSRPLIVLVETCRLLTPLPLASVRLTVRLCPRSRAPSLMCKPLCSSRTEKVQKMHTDNRRCESHFCDGVFDLDAVLTAEWCSVTFPFRNDLKVLPLALM